MSSRKNPPIRISTGKESEGYGVSIEAVIEDPENQFSPSRAILCEIQDGGIKRIFIGSRYGGSPEENKKAVKNILEAEEERLSQKGIKVIAEVIEPFEPGK